MPKARGRPSSYTAEIGDAVCKEIAQGRSVNQIERDPGMPNGDTIRRWVDRHEDFRDKYARAREEQADYYAADIIEIADTEEDPQRARVRIDARKWVASKLKPKSYGERLQAEVSGQVTINVISRADKPAA